MPPGKMAAQAVHAARLSLMLYLRKSPRAEEFLTLGSCGSVVMLRTKNLAAMERAKSEAEEMGLPTALFFDQGHILPPHFTGEPIPTALAIGPAGRDVMRPITKRFRCL